MTIRCEEGMEDIKTLGNVNEDSQINNRYISNVLLQWNVC